jgi:hypothetical protein
MEEHFKRAIANVTRHGDTDIFPFPIENHVFHDCPLEVMKLLSELHSNFSQWLAGYPRSTQDMDIWIAVSPQNAARMVAALSEFGFGTPDLSADLFLARDRIVRMGIPPMRIEVMTTISGVRFEDCLPSAWWTTSTAWPSI